MAGRSYPDSVPAAREFLVALETVERAIFSIQVPSSAQADVAALVGSMRAMITRLQDFIAQPNAQTWSAYGDASTAVSSASNAVRYSLGLPPVPN